jgi:hypothetical protein
MSYDPSHRKPPRQERWPNATPPEGWPSHRDGDAYLGGEQAGSRYGARYGAERQGAYPATAGYRIQSGYRSAGGYDTADGYGDGRDGGYDWDADRAGGYPGRGYTGGINGYAGATDDFDGAAHGYRHAAGDYGSAADDFRGYPGQSRGGYAEPAPSDPRLTAPDAGLRPDSWQADQDRRREARQRGPVVGAVTAFLAVAVVIGVSTLAAAFVRPQASPITVVGGVFVDRTPAALKNFAIHHFGTHGRAVLLLGMYATLALVALVIGMLARREAALGVAAIGAFSLFGAFVAITRPEGHITDVAPSVIGGLAGVAALLWLVRASAPPPRVAPVRYVRGGSRRRAR